jgi:hypothetical protein
VKVVGSIAPASVPIFIHGLSQIQAYVVFIHHEIARWSRRAAVLCLHEGSSRLINPGLHGVGDGRGRMPPYWAMADSVGR